MLKINRSRRAFLGKATAGSVALAATGAGGVGVSATARGAENQQIEPFDFRDIAAQDIRRVMGGERSASAEIAVREFGNPRGKPIVFLHSFNQNHLCWYKQLASAELAQFRLIAVDLRGHGDSDKPIPSGFPDTGYDPDDWADDLANVIADCELERPLLVGWSYAGYVICDYLRLHGWKNVAGVNFVAAAIRYNPPSNMNTFLGPIIGKLAPDILAPDLPSQIRGIHNYLNASVAKPLAPTDFAMALAYNAAVPLASRISLLLRPPVQYDKSLLPKLDLPVLVSHGDLDRVVLPASSRAIVEATRGAKLSIYEDIGHAPFLELPERFNAELAAFRAAN